MDVSWHADVGLFPMIERRYNRAVKGFQDHFVYNYELFMNLSNS